MLQRADACRDRDHIQLSSINHHHLYHSHLSTISIDNEEALIFGLDSRFSFCISSDDIGVFWKRRKIDSIAWWFSMTLFCFVLLCWVGYDVYLYLTVLKTKQNKTKQRKRQRVELTIICIIICTRRSERPRICSGKQASCQSIA